MSKKETLNTLYRIVKIGSKSFLISLFGVILCALANYGLNYTLGLLSQVGLEQVSNKTFDFKEIINILLLALALLPITYIGQSLNLIGGLNSEKRVKTKLIDHALREKSSDISSKHSAKFMTLFNSDASVVENLYFQGLNYMFINPLLSGTLSLITIFIIDYRFGILALFLGILIILTSLIYTNRTQEAYIDARDKDEESIMFASEIISNEMMIRQYAIEDEILSTYKLSNDKYKEAKIKADNIKHFISLNQGLINMLSMASFLMLGFYLSINTDFNFTTVMLLLPLRAQTSWMFLSFGSSYSFLLEVSISAKRILDFLDSGSEDARESYPAIEIDNKQTIDIANLHFAYKDKTVLKDLNLSVKSKSSLGIVGSSGSGKSTIFKLLMGLMDDYDGIIRLYDRDILEANLDSLRSHIVSVEQEAPLFNKTIFENIAFGSKRDDVSLAEVINVCKKVNMHDFIMSLELGYDTIVGESASSISGGQRQRLAIARALMSDASIILMDEPTSALDRESEEIINDVIKGISNDKTVIVISHRISSVKDLDNIAVLADGSIKEYGSHSELKQNDSLYASLLSNQGGN